MAAYTDVAAIEGYLGVELTSEQAIEAMARSEAVTAWIDQECGRSWQGDSPVTAEPHTVEGGLVYLDHPPVTAITAVTVRPKAVAGTVTTLTASTEYELLDPAAGILLLSASSYLGYLAKVSYTHSAVVPPDIVLAATILAAAWLGAGIGSAPNVESVSVDDVRVQYGEGAVPGEVAEILAAHRRAFVFA